MSSWDEISIHLGFQLILHRRSRIVGMQVMQSMHQKQFSLQWNTLVQIARRDLVGIHKCFKGEARGEYAQEGKITKGLQI